METFIPATQETHLIADWRVKWTRCGSWLAGMKVCIYVAPVWICPNSPDLYHHRDFISPPLSHCRDVAGFWSSSNSGVSGPVGGFHCCWIRVSISTTDWGREGGSVWGSAQDLFSLGLFWWRFTEIASYVLVMFKYLITCTTFFFFIKWLKQI